jgi:hypothetical protein
VRHTPAVLALALVACLGEGDESARTPARQLATAAPVVIVADTLTMGPGDSRVYELVPGRYEIRVTAPTPPGEPQAIDLAAELKCVPDRQDRDLIHCLVRMTTPMVLRHTGVLVPTPRRSVIITIVRVAPVTS